MMDDIRFMDRGTPEWDRAWGALAAMVGDVDQGDGWQYMGTFGGAHQFRNRDVDGTGRRVVIDIREGGAA